MLVRFLQRFDKLENMEAPGPIRLHHAIENRSGSGVVVRLREAGKGGEGEKEVID